MPVVSNNKYICEQYLKRPKLLFDSTVLCNLYRDINAARQFSDLIDSPLYTLLVPAPCLLEVEIGPAEKRSTLATEADAILLRGNRLNWVDAFHAQAKQIDIPKYNLYAPSPFEFHAARVVLLGLANQKNWGSKRLSELRLDALIWSCARNLFSMIVTENVRDFQDISSVTPDRKAEISPPIWTLEQIHSSLSRDVLYCDCESQSDPSAAAASG